MGTQPHTQKGPTLTVQCSLVAVLKFLVNLSLNFVQSVKSNGTCFRSRYLAHPSREVMQSLGVTCHYRLGQWAHAKERCLPQLTPPAKPQHVNPGLAAGKPAARGPCAQGHSIPMPEGTQYQHSIANKNHHNRLRKRRQKRGESRTLSKTVMALFPAFGIRDLPFALCTGPQIMQPVLEGILCSNKEEQRNGYAATRTAQTFCLIKDTRHQRPRST